MTPHVSCMEWIRVVRWRWSLELELKLKLVATGGAVGVGGAVWQWSGQSDVACFGIQVHLSRVSSPI